MRRAHRYNPLKLIREIRNPFVRWLVYAVLLICVIVSIVFVNAAIFLGLAIAEETVSHRLQTRNFGNFQIRVDGTESWDNYCFPKSIKVYDKAGRNIAIQGFKQPAGGPCPSDRNFVEIADYNGDNYPDFKITNDSMNVDANGSYNYATYLYNSATNTFKANASATP